MSDEANAASNAAPADVAQPVTATPPAEPQQAAPDAAQAVPSAREALERAMAKTDPDQAAKPERARTPDGKFAPGQTQQPAQVTTGQNTAEALAAEQAAKDAAAKAPPAQIAHPGLTKEAQAEWANAPETLRNDVMRRVTELTQGMEKYKGEAEIHAKAFEPVRRFDEMARKSGTTLEAALTNYTGIEDAILANPVQGFLQICQNMNINPQALGQALAGLSPQQIAQMPQAQQQPQTPAELQAIKDEIAEIKRQSQQAQIEQTITSFASEKDADGALKHPYFDELATSISEMLETKFAKNLSDAYEKAVRLSPEIAARIAEDKRKAAPAVNQPDPAQTREKAGKSITGSPNSGSNPTTRKPAGSTREALSNAFAQVGL